MKGEENRYQRGDIVARHKEVVYNTAPQLQDNIV